LLKSEAMPANNNLWGNLPRVTEPQPTPLSILREQAEILTSATNGVLEGEVATFTGAEQAGGATSSAILGRLSIVAPALGRYSQPIIEVTYNLMGYQTGIIIVNLTNNEQRKCFNIQSYKGILAQFLSSPSIRNIIHQLLTQSNV
jgi:hypothetical protein